MKRLKLVVVASAVAAMLVAGQAPAMADVNIGQGDIDFDQDNGGVLIVGNNDVLDHGFLDDIFGSIFDDNVVFSDDGGVSQVIGNESEPGDVDISFTA